MKTLIHSAINRKYTLCGPVNYLYSFIAIRTACPWFDKQVVTSCCPFFILDKFFGRKNINSTTQPTPILPLLNYIQKWLLNENGVLAISRDYILY